MYIQEENKNRMSDAKVDPVQIDNIVGATLENLNKRGITTAPAANSEVAANSEGGVTDTQPKKSKAELIAAAKAKLVAAGEDAALKAAAQAELEAAEAMPDEVSGGEKAPPATDMYNIDGEKGVDGEFKYSDLGAINAARAAEQPPRESLFELKPAAGGGRRTRRRNKKSGKKSRRQSKKGGKKHRNTGSKKSKKSRRYSSRK